MKYSELFNIPNVFTFLRIVVSPYIAFLMIQQRYKEGVIWILIAGLTDFLDGFLARKLGQSSDLGAVLDPLADKIFAIILFATCVYLRWIPLWFVSLAFLRELIILGGILFLSSDHILVEIKPLLSSKINTCFQFLLLCSILLRNIFGLDPLVQILLIATTCTTLYSGFEYVCVGVSTFNNRRA